MPRATHTRPSSTVRAGLLILLTVVVLIVLVCLEAAPAADGTVTPATCCPPVELRGAP